jgi:cation/acetate symporter
MLGMAIVFFYAVLGGMKGITYTQAAQYCILIFAYMVPAIFISLMMTSNPIPQLGFGSMLSDGSGVYLLDRLDGISQELGFHAYTEGSKSTIDIFFITAALMVGTAGLPHVIVRFFTVPKVRDARISAGWALLFIAILYTTAPAIAGFARVNMVDTLNGPESKGTLYEEAPSWVTNWEKTGLIAWEDKNQDGRMFYSGDERNEMTIDRDIMVLANPEIARLPNWVVALIAAGALAAALSTAAGLLLVVSTSISHDLLKRNLMPGISEKKELLSARIAAAVAVCVAGYLGVNPPGFVAEVVAFAFGLAAATFFPAIIMGIFFKRMNDKGAIAGMVAGLIFTAGYIVTYKGIFITPLLPNTAEHWLLGISPEGIGTLGMLLNFCVATLVWKLTGDSPTEVQDIVESIRFPRGSSQAQDH